MYQVAATITVFDEGWVVEWGEKHIACKTERELAKVIGRQASELRIGRDGGLEAYGRVVQFPHTQPVIPIYDLPPTEQAQHAARNLERLAEAFVTSQIDGEMFEKLLPGSCPGVTPEQVSEAMYAAERKYYEPTQGEAEGDAAATDHDAG
jgi:hypothetical protein